MNFIKTRLSQLSTTGLMIGVIIFAIITLLYTLVAYQQWATADTHNYDLGIFTQLAKAYASFQAPIVPIKKDDYNLLGDHFHPILIFLGPTYALFPSAFTLLVVQAALFALASAVFAYTCCQVFTQIMTQGVLLPSENGHYKNLRKNIKKYLPYIAGLGGGFAFGVSWGLQAAAVSQFHEIAFAIPILAFTFHYFIFERYTGAIIWGGLLIFVKEDMGLTVFMFGLVLAWRVAYRNHQTHKAATVPQKNKNTKKTTPKAKITRKNPVNTWCGGNKWIFGLLLAAWGIFWYWYSTTVFLPAFNTEDKFDYSDKADLSEAFKDPSGTLSEIFSNDAKMTALGLLVAVSAGTLFFSPLSLLALPTLAWRLLSPDATYWSPERHYDAILVPIVMFCLPDLIYKISLWYQEKNTQQDKKTRAPQKTPLQKNVASTGQKAKKVIAFYGLYIAVPIIILVATINIFKFTSGSYSADAPLVKAFNSQEYQPTPNEASVLEAAALIPDNKEVEADHTSLNYLVDSSSRLNSGKDPINTLYAYWYRYPKPANKPAPDYILVNFQGPNVWDPAEGNTQQLTEILGPAKKWHPEAEYEIIYDKNDVQVVKKIN